MWKCLGLVAWLSRAATPAIFRWHLARTRLKRRTAWLTCTGDASKKGVKLCMLRGTSLSPALPSPRSHHAIKLWQRKAITIGGCSSSPRWSAGGLSLPSPWCQRGTARKCRLLAMCPSCTLSMRACRALKVKPTLMGWGSSLKSSNLTSTFLTSTATCFRSSTRNGPCCSRFLSLPRSVLGCDSRSPSSNSRLLSSELLRSWRKRRWSTRSSARRIRICTRRSLSAMTSSSLQEFMSRPVLPGPSTSRTFCSTTVILPLPAPGPRVFPTSGSSTASADAAQSCLMATDVRERTSSPPASGPFCADRPREDLCRRSRST
mmetsp:Transcript_46149/g.147371  ORF Transcript_46149/g.147371 Transcript_46149/m.147371 type:complete len:318 (-) Transcript_46149:193-1146(-)